MIRLSIGIEHVNDLIADLTDTQFNLPDEEKMEKKRHEVLAEEHLKNLSKESHTLYKQSAEQNSSH